MRLVGWILAVIVITSLVLYGAKHQYDTCRSKGNSVTWCMFMSKMYF